nr:MAG TPA: hypothetical protein [Bacteriophage sp.]
MKRIWCDFYLFFTKDMRVKNIGEVKFLSHCIEQPTIGLRRKQIPFFSLSYPRHTISY